MRVARDPMHRVWPGVLQHLGLLFLLRERFPIRFAIAVLSTDSHQHSFQVPHKVIPTILCETDTRFRNILFVREVLFDFAFHRRVPMVLDGIVGPANTTTKQKKQSRYV